MANKTHQNYRKENAQGMVEFALVLPMLLILIFGVIEIGRLLFIYSAVSTASREAARYGSAAGDNGSGIPRYEDCAGIRAAAERIGTLASVQDSNITITYDHGPGSGSPFATCEDFASSSPPSINPGDQVEDRVVVRVNITYTPIVPLVNLASFPITSVSSRTILSDVRLDEPQPAPGGIPTAYFENKTQSVDEGNTALVRIKLSGYSSSDITVVFTVGGTANDPADYTRSPSGLSVVIPAGSVSKTIDVDTLLDGLDEYDESIIFTLGSGGGYSVGSPSSDTITVVDQDDPPTVSFASATSPKMREDSGSHSISVQLSGPSGKNILVPFYVDGASTALEGSDYTLTPDSPKELVFPAGSTQQSIFITPLVDTPLDENDESVVLKIDTAHLSNVNPGAITTHTATIEDIDNPPTVRFTWATQDVPDTVNPLLVRVELNTVSGRDVTVPFGISAVSTGYSLLTPNPLVIPAGSTSADILIGLTDDGDGLPTATVTVSLGTPINAQLGTPNVHTATITNTAAPPTVYFTTASQSKSEDGKSMTVVVQLSAAWSQDVTVPFSLSGTAQGLGVDYTITPSPVVIKAGSASANILITIIDDSLYEDNETVILTMGTPTNAQKDTLRATVHTATIIDNDPQPVVTFATDHSSGMEDVGTIPVVVQLNTVSSKDVIVPFAVSNLSTATQGSDYTLSPANTVIIPAGSTSATIDINVINDTVVGEEDETIILMLGTPQYATLGMYTTHTATIAAWVCPSATSDPYFGSGSDSKKLVWEIQTANPKMVNLLEVTVYWPTGNSAQINQITFGGTAIGASYYYPASLGYLDVVNPTPLWNGVFSTRQMIFLFSNNPNIGGGQEIVVSARFENCPPFSKRISK
jgi:Flp pilus assembly protein TadG